ncbi:glycosyltransferase family 61 protein [Nocardioides terrisoli]|uniref:glycosyltransferase family 61 protein n=1 Tax=Nocardioides terrisoli TaxID=3388267 RepID=UPI00287BB23A|nr:glycosyltransferase family 61 protein [Nocardioides marmorisolisilvae]
MSRLPPALQPAWPLVKRGHRLATRGVGAATRHIPDGARSLPRLATERAEDTAAREPDVVRLHLGGPGEALRRPIPVGQPADHWIFRWRSSYDVPRRFTLDIGQGTVVGLYAATLTPGGVLDFETSAYFGIDGWREHPLYLRPRLPEPEDFDGTLLSLTTSGTSANYFHFVTDTLPRWGVLEECLPDVRPDACYVSTGSRYQRELLGMLGIDTLPVVEPGKHRAVRARRLLVPSLSNPDLMAPSWTQSWLKRRLPDRGGPDLPRRLYLSRGTKRNTRRLVDEDRHMKVLEHHGFTTIDPGTLSVQEQIDVFAAAEAIVAPHGAALTNLAFANPGLRLLELFAPNYVNPCYWTMADNIPDVRYRYLVGSGRAPRPRSPMNGVLADIRLDPRDFEAAVDDLLA